jgi:hypothetical protein
VLWSSAPDCPVCHQIVSGAPGPYRAEPATLGFLQTVRCATGLSGVLAEQRLSSAMVDCNGALTALQCATEVRAEVRGAPDSEQDLSGVAPDCPVPQEDKASNSRLLPDPNGWVTWRHTGQCQVAHWTVRCAHRQQPSPTAIWWLRAINTPNHHNLKHPSFLKFPFNTRASTFTPRHKSKDQSLSKSQFHSNRLVTWERVCSCSLRSCCLDRFLTSSFLFLRYL